MSKDPSPNEPIEFNPIHPEPLLIVISGPSGVGKDAVIKGIKARGVPFDFVITATTRDPRNGELHGSDYFFVTKEAFAEMIDRDELLEYALDYGEYRGVPKEQVRKAMESGKDVIMRIDVQGSATIRKICPEAVTIFLTTQSEEELVERLRARKTEPPEGIRMRITTARQELKRIGEFDYFVVNRDKCLDETVNTILSIIHSEHQRVHPRKVTL
jgi:guanylate kinase